MLGGWLLGPTQLSGRAKVTPAAAFQEEEAGGSKLKQLKFNDTDLTSVATEVLVGDFQKLEKVEFWGGKREMIRRWSSWVEWYVGLRRVLSTKQIRSTAGSC